MALPMLRLENAEVRSDTMLKPTPQLGQQQKRGPRLVPPTRADNWLWLFYTSAEEQQGAGTGGLQ